MQKARQIRLIRTAKNSRSAIQISTCDHFESLVQPFCQGLPLTGLVIDFLVSAKWFRSRRETISTFLGKAL